MDIFEKRLLQKVPFGERLAQARIHFGLSQEALAEAVGTTPRSISRWEHNQAVPQQYYRQRLCNVLQTTPEALFGEEKEKQPTDIQADSLWYVPYPRNPYFVGRETILNQIHDRLHTKHQVALTQPQVLSGLGGIGKTQTALEYVYRYRTDYQTVLWAGAETSETLMSDYRLFAHLFQFPEKDSPDHILREAVKRWFQNQSGWLLVFDNVEDLELLTPMLPDTTHGCILITTRSQLIGTFGVRLDLPKMEQTEGALFVLRRADLLRVNESLETVPAALRTQAEILVDLMDGLPLALDQAGAYIEETACTLSDYLNHYTHQRGALLGFRGATSTQHPASVASSFSLSFQRIEQISSVAADLLRFCAFLHADGIPLALILQAGEEPGSQLQAVSTHPMLLDATIRELRRFSLIHRDTETRTLSIHRLLQAMLQEHIEKEEQKRWVMQIIQAMLRVFPNYREIAQNDLEEQVLYQPYLPHALRCIEHSETLDILTEDVCELLYRIGMYLHYQGNPTQGLPFLRRAFHITENLFGEEHETTLFYLKKLGVLYKEARQLEESERCFRRILLIYEKMNEPNHVNVSECLWNLAHIFSVKGLTTQAISFAQRSLILGEQIYGPDHYEVAIILNMLAIANVTKGEYHEAEKLFRRVHSIFEKTVGGNHLFMASCFANLGYVSYMQERYSEAATAYQRTLMIYEKKFGVSLPLGGDFILNMLGTIYFQQKQYHQAELSYRRSLEIFERSPNADLFSAVYSFVGLAELYLVQNHQTLAQRALQQAFTISGHPDQVHSVDDREIAHFLSLLGDQLTSQGRVSRAHIFYQRAERMSARILQADHPPENT